MGKSKIQWTDETWNPVRGCVPISPGCKHCYAKTFSERFRGVKGHPYEQGFDPRLVPEKLEEPLRWAKPRRVFVNSMSDLFGDFVPEAFLDQVFGVMAGTERHTFQVLTKRAQRMHDYMEDWCRRTQARPPPNVWLGVSVENQEYADERIPHLLRTPAAVRFLSIEPLLGQVNLTCVTETRRDMRTDGGETKVTHNALRGGPFTGLTPKTRIDWVIVGGESGAGARPFRIEWARSIVEQCKTAGVPVFVKQLGSNPEEEVGGGVDALDYCSTPVPLQLNKRKGDDPAEWPADLRVREFPDG